MLSDLDLKLKGFKVKPQTKEQALKNLERLKKDIGMANVKSNKEEVRKILKRAGSLSEEILYLHKQERS